MTKTTMLYFFSTSQTRRAKKLDTGLVSPNDAFYAYGDFILILTFVP